MTQRKADASRNLYISSIFFVYRKIAIDIITKVENTTTVWNSEY